MIGIFDSGVGGLSIVEGINRILPKEDIVFLADRKNFPYGAKKKNELKLICKNNTELLISKNAKLIIVACNTATVSVISYLRSQFSIPIVGIVPVVKTASSVTKNNKIGILATKSTIKGKLYKDLILQFCKDKQVYSWECPNLVYLIENNFFDISDDYLLDSIKPLLEKKVDTITLGCTHYHFLKDRFKKVAGSKINVLSSEDAVARQVKNVLINNKQLSEQKSIPKYYFFTNKNVSYFTRFIEKVMTFENKNDGQINLVKD